MAMTDFRAWMTGALAVGGASWAIAEGMPPIEAFARMEEISSVAISPDGHYLSWVQGLGKKHILQVISRGEGAKPQALLRTDSHDFDLAWCAWANNERLLCGFRASVVDGYRVYPVTRLAGVNADGKKVKVLLQRSSAGDSQFQDDVLDWTPADPKTVLVAAQESDRTVSDPTLQIVGSNRHLYPSVFELDIYSGRLSRKIGDREPILNFVSDTHGHVRLGSGIRDKEVFYFARLEGESAWRPLSRVLAFDRADHSLRPIAVGREPNTAYALGDGEGRTALWEMDLTDKTDAHVVFAHPQVDVSKALFEKDGRMIGVAYATDRPFVYYTDPRAQAVIASVNKLLPDSFNVIADSTADESAYVIEATSDVNAGDYYVLDTKAGQMKRIGAAYPDLDPKTLGRMRSIAYPARDGTMIPGYLTVPPGLRAEHLPLIVMPHGGPISRDRWAFFFLQQFLVSRGYAVLQMNFRGSGGYGDDWFWAAHQDWGGLTYDDITDGARWAVKQGIADPARICMVGWSFGGYAALLGAVRDSALYRCSVSIAGVSDLTELEVFKRNFLGGEISREQIGTDTRKLREESPRRHAETVSIPILLIHGDHDYNVGVNQSEMMGRALDREHKSYEFIRIVGANHYMERESERVRLLAAVEKFLTAHLGPGVQQR